MRQLSIDRGSKCEMLTTTRGGSDDYLLALNTLDDGHFYSDATGISKVDQSRVSSTSERRKSDDIYNEVLNLLEGPILEATQTSCWEIGRNGIGRGELGSGVSGGNRTKKQEKRHHKAVMRNLAPRPIAPRPVSSPIQDGARFWGVLAKQREWQTNSAAPDDELKLKRDVISDQLFVSPTLLVLTSDMLCPSRAIGIGCSPRN